MSRMQLTFYYFHKYQASTHFRAAEWILWMSTLQWRQPEGCTGKSWHLVI